LENNGDKLKVMITGGLGHIGSCLIERIPESFDIIIVDNLLTQRFCSLFNRKRKIVFLDEDIENIKVSHLADVDVVIHLAAITNSVESFKNKEEMEVVNIIKTEKFINTCKNACIPRLIFPSSASVYGVDSDYVYEDDNSFINPQSPYAEAKIKVENTIKRSLGNDTKFVILRFGTIFGISQGMRFHTAINKFCYQAAMNKPLTVWRQNYNHIRPYLGINDAINSMIFFIESCDSTWNETYNVLTSNYSLHDIIEMIMSIDNSVSIDLIDSPLVNQHSYRVSDKKIKNIGFIPNDDMVESIKETLLLLGHRT
jgi:nucleoside-diphosphate-sugar epimerase